MATETVTPASVPWWRQQLQQRRRRGGRTPPPSPSSTPVPTSSSSPISLALPTSPTLSPNASTIASSTSQSASRTSSNSHQHPSSPATRTKMSAATSGSPPMERSGTGRLTGRSTSRYIDANGEIVVIGAVQGSKADAPDVRSEAQGPTSGQAGRGAAVSQPGEETGSSAELQYGPGYVSRLKSRYLSMAREGTSPGSGSPRRRVVSLEDILQGEGAFERGSVQDSYVLSAARAGPWAESMRKAKSSGDLIQGRVGRGGRVGLRSPVATPRRDSSSNRGAIAVSPVRPARGIDVSQQAAVRGSGVGQRPTLVVARELPAADTVSTVKRLFEERPRWVGASSNSSCGNTPSVRTCDKSVLRRQQRSPQRSVQSSPQRSPNQSLQHSPQQSLQNFQDNSVHRAPQSSLQKLPLQASKQPLNRSPKPPVTPPPSQLKLRSPRQSPVKSRSLLNGRTADELRRNATRDPTESAGDNQVTNRQPESLPCLRRDLKPLPVGSLAKSNTSRRRNSLSSQVTPSSPETGSVQQDTRRCVEPGDAGLNSGASGRDNLRSTETRNSGTVGIIGTPSETEMSNRPVITDALKAPYASSVATLRGDEDSGKGTASTSSSVLKRQVGVIKPTPKPLPQDELNRRKNALNQAKSSASKFNTVSEKVQAFQSRSSPRALANGHRAHNKEKMVSPQPADKGLTHRPALLEGAHARNNQSHLHITNTSTSPPSAQSSAVAEAPSSSRSHAVTNGMSVPPLRQFTTSPSQTTSAHPPPGDSQPKLSAPSGNAGYLQQQQHAAAPATPAAASLPPAAAAPAADALRWHQIPDNVLVFNFTSRQGVPDYVEDDGLDIHRRAHPKVGDGDRTRSPTCPCTVFERYPFH